MSVQTSRSHQFGMATYFLSYDSESTEGSVVEMAIIVWRKVGEVTVLDHALHSLIVPPKPVNDQSYVVHNVHGIYGWRAQACGMSWNDFLTQFTTLHQDYGSPPIYTNGVSMEDYYFLSRDKHVDMTNMPLKPWLTRVQDPIHRIVRYLQHRPSDRHQLIRCDPARTHNTLSSNQQLQAMFADSPQLWKSKDQLACHMNINHDGYKPDPLKTNNRSAHIKFKDGVHCAFFDALEVGLHAAMNQHTSSACFLSRRTLVLKPQPNAFALLGTCISHDSPMGPPENGDAWQRTKTSSVDWFTEDQ